MPHLRGLQAAEQNYGVALRRQLEAEFLNRMRNRLPKDTAIGRWEEDSFAALFQGPKEDVRAGQMADKLSGPYPCLHEGRTVRPLLKVEVSVAESLPDDSTSRTVSGISDGLAVAS